LLAQILEATKSPLSTTEICQDWVAHDSVMQIGAQNSVPIQPLVALAAESGRFQLKWFARANQLTARPCGIFGRGGGDMWQYLLFSTRFL
jgi:hypothetical protein